MDLFSNLPENVVYDICQSLNTRDLSNLMEASSRVYQICGDILSQRLEQRKTLESSKVDIKTLVNYAEHPKWHGLYYVNLEFGEIDIFIEYKSDLLIAFGFYIEGESGESSEEEEEEYKIQLRIPSDKIPRFLDFLRSLTSEENIVKEFEGVKFKIETSSFVKLDGTLNEGKYLIIDDGTEELIYDYDDFLEILPNIIKFISKRYYNLKLGLETKLSRYPNE